MKLANNRLPGAVKLRLYASGVSQETVALRSPGFHPQGRRVSQSFVYLVLNRKRACPLWLRREIEYLLNESRA